MILLDGPKMCVTLIAFVIFLLISDVASFDVCAIKDGKVLGPPQVKWIFIIWRLQQ